MKNSMTVKKRLIVILVYVSFLMVISKLVTGTWIPTTAGKNLWFFNSVALWFFTGLSAPFFVKPKDAVARSATAAFQLSILDLSAIANFNTELNWFRWFAFGLAGITTVFGVIAVLSYSRERDSGQPRSDLSRIAYRVAERLGRGQIVFTPAVLISILGFYQNNIVQQLWLLFFWSLLIFVQPVELVLQIFEAFRKSKTVESRGQSLGEIQRVDYPNIIRVRLESADNWRREVVHTACLADSRQVEVLPLFVQTQNRELIGTGICHKEINQVSDMAIPGRVFLNLSSRSREEVTRELSGGEGELIGFVVEESSISTIKFEVSADVALSEGALVTVLQTNASSGELKGVYYQILDAATDEESFAQNPLGRHIASAEQLGEFDPERGFVKYGWLPMMNSPVFLINPEMRLPSPLGDDEFVIGTVPYSKIEVVAKLNDITQYHTAILGVTGTGKTELAFEMIRFALTQSFKVFCVDFTAEYEQRLKDLAPIILELPEEDSNDLRDKLFEVETGDYAAGPEKVALKRAVDELKPTIDAQTGGFLRPNAPALGILRLEEIANTRATLRLTEMYLSSIFDLARKHRRSRRILIVLEEAHTIVPEMNLFGRFDRTETESVLGRISQIALQGRKYGVGLLLVTQRTALVSKTLLSQCNTVVSFGMHDETGLKYLANVFNTDHVSAIPNLKRFQAIAFGKGIKSERPIIFQISEDPKKRDASDLLDKVWDEEVPAVVEDEQQIDQLPKAEPEPEALPLEDDDIPF